MLFSETAHTQKIQRNAELWDSAASTQLLAQQIQKNINFLNDQKMPAGLIAFNAIASMIFITYMLFEIDLGQTLNITFSTVIFIMATAIPIIVVFDNQSIDNLIAQQEQELEELLRE